MVKALARAFSWRRMLDTGVHATIEDLPTGKGIAKAYVSRILRLTLLAPEIVEAILDGRQPADLQLEDLLQGFPLEWAELQKELGFRPLILATIGPELETRMLEPSVLHGPGPP